MNAQSVKNKTLEIESFLSENKPKIFCVAEHWLNNETRDISLDNNYKLASIFCRKKSRGGGTAIYCLNEIKFENVDYITKSSIENTIECCGIKTEINKEETTILCIYRPPYPTNFKIFTEILEDILTKIDTTNIIIAGDYNCNTVGNGPEESELNSLLQSYGMELTIKNQSTRGYKGRIIDNIYTNLDCKEAKVINQVISDHFPLEITFDNNEESSGTVLKRQYNHDNHQTFRQIFITWNWQELIQTDGANDCFNLLYKNFMYCFNVAYPMILTKNNKTTKSVWVTNEVKNSQKEVNNLCWLSKISDNENIKRKYSQKKKEHKSLLQNKKRIQNDRKILLAKNKTREIWNIIKPRQVARTNIKFKIEDNICTDPGKNSNYINKFFVDEIKTITENFAYKDLELKNAVRNSMFVYPVLPAELVDIANKHFTKTSSGCDGVPANILKIHIHTLAEPLSVAINKSLEQGIFPDILKQSKIVPILKRGDANLMENYRPVAVQMCFGKLYELIFAVRLTKYIEKYGLISETQHGFLKKRSTNTAMYELLNSIYEQLDNKRNVVGCFYDMSKAFDCVQHSVLYDSLENIGVRDTALKWIKSFLTDRNQKVVINHLNNDGQNTIHTSDPLKINTGIVQGSTLGPLLFVILINTLPQQITSGKLIIYADDINHIMTTNNDLQKIEATKNSINEVEKWCKKVGLKPNNDKLKILEFTASTNNNNMLLWKENRSLPISQETRFLGISITENLKWQEHVKVIIPKLSKTCYQLKSLQPVTSKEVLHIAYYACFQSVMQYGVMYWGNSPPAKSVLLLQKRALRFMHNTHPKEHCKPLFRKSNILTLYGLTAYNLIMYAYDNDHIFTRNKDVNTTHSTRYGETISIPMHRTTLYENSPYYQMVKLCNAVPQNIKSAGSRLMFKSELRKWLMDVCPYGPEEMK